MTIAPTIDQVEARLETLSPRLRSALFSVEVTKAGEEIGLANGLYDGDIPFLADVIAWVLMGFVHSSDTTQAIEDHVDVDTETAKAIAQSLNDKVFRVYNADLEKTYTPMGIAPAKAMDISAPNAPARASMAPAPMPVTPISVTSTPSMVPKMPTPAPATMQATIPKAPLPTAPIKEEPKGWQPTKLPISGPAPVGKATPISTATPAPFMMHQESSASPLVTSSDFKLNISKDMFKSGPTKQIEIPRPPKAAELEIGKAPLPPKPAGNVSFRTSPLSQSRVVHYTDLHTNMSPGFPAAQPMPKITPTAPTPAMPAMTSTPIMPAAKPIATPVLKTMSAPVPPAPIAPSMPKPPEPIKQPMPPSAPMPIAPAPMGQTTSPTMPATPTTPVKPPKVVNFGPEEVK